MFREITLSENNANVSKIFLERIFVSWVPIHKIVKKVKSKENFVY